MDQLRARATFDLDCPRSKIQTYRIDNRTVGVTGCGQRVTYVETCDGAPGDMMRNCTWVLNADARPTDDERRSRSSDKKAKVEPAPAAPARDPEGLPEAVAGFHFNVSPETSKRDCVGAGHTWEAVDTTTYRCSGTPEDTGLGAFARLEYCDDFLCSIKLVVPSNESDPRETWQAFTKVRKTLKRRYGHMTRHERGLSGNCRDNMWPCLAEGRAVLLFKWRRSDGRIILSLGRGSEEGVAIRIHYRRREADKKHAAGASARQSKESTVPGL